MAVCSGPGSSSPLCEPAHILSAPGSLLEADATGNRRTWADDLSTVLLFLAHSQEMDLARKSQQLLSRKSNGDWQTLRHVGKQEAKYRVVMKKGASTE